jgi:hypothetical protein
MPGLIEVAMYLRPSMHENRCRLNGDNFDVGFLLFEIAPGSHQCSAGSNRRQKMRNATIGLIPDFRPRSVIMCQRIVFVVVLIRLEITIRVLA